MKNHIYTNEEYMAQGFAAHEVDKIRRHDILFNKRIDGIITEAECEEMFALVQELGL